MRKVIFLVHTSVDGFVAGPNGEMDWIRVDDEIFEAVNLVTNNSDTALYSRVTYHMMEGYWPTAAEKPGASKHDIEHSRWANKAAKLVFSTTLKETHWENTRIVRGNEAKEIAALKQQAGKNILLLGSPRLAQSLMQQNLIDEYYINVNPVILGKGISLFSNRDNRIDLRLKQSTTYKSGVTTLHYEVVR
jgi:dihydrofolate reductase